MSNARLRTPPDCRGPLERGSHERDGTRIVAINIFVCATYHSMFAEGTHQTVGAFTLGTFPLSPFDVVYTQARLIRFGLGDYAD